MNRFSLSIFSIIVLLSLFSVKAQTPNNIIKSESKINKIIIHNKGAHIERIGSAKISIGSNELVITNLSPSLINESIQFLMNSKEIIVNSITKKMNYLGVKTDQDNEISSLKDSLSNLNEIIRLKEIKKAVLVQEIDLLDQNKSVLKTSREFIVEDLMDLSEYFKKRMYEIQAEVSLTEKEIKKLKLRIVQINTQINSINTNNKNLHSNIIIQLTCIKSGEYNYELSYNSNNAGWAPSYDVISSGVNKPVELTYKAKIYQNTNEIWSNIQLSLSTGKLNKSNNYPAFKTQYINSFNGISKTNQIKRNKNYNSRAQKVEIPKMNEDVSISSSEFTNIDFSGTQIAYNISLPYSIPSQKEPIFIDIQKLELDAKYDYYCYPKLDKDIFLMCHFESLGNKNLLPGNANVYFNGKSVGKTYLDPYSIKKTHNLSLSRDISIICERILEKKFSSETKIGDNIKIERSYILKLINNKDLPITLVLVDQIPLSTDKSITVQLIESSQAELNKNNGKLIWNIILNPNEIIEKKFTFSVKHPMNNNIIGL